MSKEIRGKMENRGNRSYSLYTSANNKDMKPGKSLSNEHEPKKSGRYELLDWLAAADERQNHRSILHY